MGFWYVAAAKACFWKSNRDLVLGAIARMTAADMDRIGNGVPLAKGVPLEEKRRILGGAVRNMSDETILKLLWSL